MVLHCRPCHYVAVDVKRGNIVLGVRGSLELGDLETDVTAAPLPFEFQVGPLQCLKAVGLLVFEEGRRTAKGTAAPAVLISCIFPLLAACEIALEGPVADISCNAALSCVALVRNCPALALPLAVSLLHSSHLPADCRSAYLPAVRRVWRGGCMRVCWQQLRTWCRTLWTHWQRLRSAAQGGHWLWQVRPALQLWDGLL